MSVTQATVNPVVEASDTIPLGLDKVSNPTGKHKLTSPIPSTLTPTTVPPVSEAYSDTRALIAGADSIDLTALPNGNLPAKDFTGLKVQVIQIKVSAAATGPMTFTPGAINGYNLGGAATSLVINPGEMVIILANESQPDVAVADATIDVAGTGTEEYDVLILAG